jgi:hypothetical protein
MNLSQAQLGTLKTWLNANAAGVQDEEAAALLNAAASPAFTVWKTSVPLQRVGDNFVGTDLAGLSSLNHTRLLTVVTLSGAGVNPSLADRRAFFDDIFSGAGGAATRAKLLVLWKRLATVGEKLFATGTGSDASPATLASTTVGDVLVYSDGPVTAGNVSQARNLP